MSAGLPKRLRRTASGLYYELGQQLVNIGIRPAGRDYVRFLLLGRPRSGSNLLITTLEQHPGVQAYGELLQQPRVRWNRKLGLERQQWVDRAYTEPQEFVGQIVFRAYPTKVCAVGFKLFYHHAREEPRSKIWPFLRDDGDLHVIHLRRRNLLKLMVSRKLADESGSWRMVGKDAMKGAAEESQSQLIRLDYDELLHAFTEMRAAEQAGGDYFAGHSMLELWYEEMAQDFPAQIGRVQDFLQLDPLPLKPLTRKQATLPLDEQIANYAELKRRFAGSEWAEFFVA